MSRFADTISSEALQSTAYCRTLISVADVVPHIRFRLHPVIIALSSENETSGPSHEAPITIGDGSRVSVAAEDTSADSPSSGGLGAGGSLRPPPFNPSGVQTGVGGSLRPPPFNPSGAQGGSGESLRPPPFGGEGPLHSPSFELPGDRTYGACESFCLVLGVTHGVLMFCRVLNTIFRKLHF